MGTKNSAESSTKESRQSSDGVVWKAYRFDGQGTCFTKEFNLTDDTRNHFCWYHGQLPDGNKELSSFEGIFTAKFSPALTQEDFERMVGGGPFCDHIDGALFLRVNSSGLSLSEFSLRFAARITENSMITMSMGLDVTSGFPSEKPNLVRNKEKGVKNEKEVEDVESQPEMNERRLGMNAGEAHNPLVTIVGSLLIHIVRKHVDYLRKIVTAIEINLDKIEKSLESLWRCIEAQTKTGDGTVKREMWEDGSLAKMHLDLQRLLQVIAHAEQVFPCTKEKCTQKSWWDATNIASLEEVVGHLRRLKENVKFIGSRVAAIQAGFDSKQAARDSSQATKINQKLYYLSILSLFLLPLSFITGIFGLSVRGTPWADRKDGFRNVSLICVVMTVVLLACYTYKRIKKMVLESRTHSWIKKFHPWSNPCGGRSDLDIVDSTSVN